MFTKILVLIFLVLAATPSAQAAGESYSFTYQGFVTNTSDVPQPGLVGTFVFGIYDPTGTCLLYEETQGATSDTSAMVSLRVGSAIGDAKRTGNDPGLSMSAIYVNGSLIRAPGANCVGGYTSAAGEGRTLRVTMNGVTFSPDALISSVPRALVADTLEGLPASSFIQVGGATTQANINTLTSTGDASSAGLHNHDSRYARLGASNNFAGNSLNNVNQIGVGTAGPAADIEIAKAASTAMRINSTTNAGNSTSIDFYGNGVNRASIQSRDNSSVLNFYTAGTQALQITNTQGAIFAGSAVFGGTVGPGQYTTAGTEPALLAALTGLGATAKGYMWTNTTANTLRFWDGAAAQTILTSGGAVLSVTAGTGMTNSGTASNPVLNVTYGTAANTAIQGNATFGGDVSGTYGAIAVDRIKGITVNTAGIANGHALMYNGTNFVATTMGNFMASGSVAATGNFNMGGNLITNMGAGVAGTDATTVTQMNNAIATATSGVYLRVDGTAGLSADWDANGATAGGTRRITGLADPVVNDGAATKNYVDQFVRRDGTLAMTGANPLSVNNRIINVTNPTGPQDAATKNYVDSGFIAQGGNSFGTTVQVGSNDAQLVQLITAGAPRLTVNTAGNVGIGTAAPSQKLEVVGDVRITGGTLQGNTARTIADGGRDTAPLITRTFVTITSSYPTILYETPYWRLEKISASVFRLTVLTADRLNYWAKTGVAYQNASPNAAAGTTYDIDCTGNTDVSIMFAKTYASPYQYTHLVLSRWGADYYWVGTISSNYDN